MLLRVLKMAVLAAVWVAAGCAKLERFEFTRVCMGVQTRVVVYGADRERATDAAAGAFARIGALDAMMSDYRETSDLSRVNARAGDGTWVEVPGALVDLAREAKRIAEATGGAFDPTVGPAVRAWRQMRASGQLAKGEEIARVRALVGWRELHARPGALRLGRKGMMLDLGGIAKGFAAEAGVRALEGGGHQRCLVALAGDVFAGEPPPGERGWRIRVADGRVITLRNSGVSTSGDAEQYVEIEGVRFAHIVDPRTGMGATLRGAVSVLAPHGADADALATAVFLMGLDAAHSALREFGVTAVYLEGDAGSKGGGSEGGDSAGAGAESL